VPHVTFFYTDSRGCKIFFEICAPKDVEVSSPEVCTRGLLQGGGLPHPLGSLRVNVAPYSISESEERDDGDEGDDGDSIGDEYAIENKIVFKIRLKKTITWLI